MKKNLLLSLSFCGMAFAPLAVQADEATATVPHHKMYGFFQANEELADYGFCSLWTDAYHAVDQYTTEGVEMLYPYSGYVGPTQRISGVIGIYAGAAVDGIYYAPQYEFSSTSSMLAAPLVSHNMYTGERKELGNWAETTNTNMRVQDMTYDVKNNKLYALTFDRGVSAIYEVDRKTGAFTHVVDLEDGLGTLAADIKGTLYGIGTGNTNLYKINKATGKLSLVYKTNLKYMSLGQTMEFDKTNGDLYWGSATYGYKGVEGYPDDSYGRTYMIRFRFNEDGTVASMDNLGEVGYYSVLRAMYIPYVAAGDDAPAAPAKVKYQVATDGSRKVAISWTNPTTTFGGKNLVDLKSVTVTRNDEVIKTFDSAEMGAEMSYTDESATEDGEYKYAVYATNSVGDGERALQYQYVGLDVPSAPENLFIKVGDGSQTATISWDAPQYGAHGNKLDASSVKYDVVRQPDGSVIGKDLTECSVEDKNIRRLGKYYYVVTAKNSVGESSAETTTWVLGKAYNVTEDEPWEETFEDASSFNNHWVGVDGNEDAYSFMINSTAPSQIIGDGYDYGAVYIVNPTFTPSDVVDADDWLLAPPVKIDDDQDYVVQVSARCLTPENLAVTCGGRNLVKDQQVLAQLSLTPTTIGSDGIMPFVNYVVDLPKGAGYKCIGLHLTSKVNAQRNAFLQINDFIVRKKTAEDTGVSSVKMSDATATGYYNVNGMKLSAPQKGLNIVKMSNGKTVKRFVK